MSAHTITYETTEIVTNMSRATVTNAGGDSGRDGVDPLVRALPLRTAVLDGESVDSWIEALARRHRLGLRSLLPALGIAQTTPSTFRLLYGVNAQIWRRLEEATGLPVGRLDGAVGDPIAAAHRLRSGGTRYCPHCLGDTDGRWQLSWRLRWTVACQRHRLLLLDSCPTCSATPRIRISGVTPPLPPGACTHTITPRRQRCGTDLKTAKAIVATEDVLDVQRWTESLIGHANHPRTGQDTCEGLSNAAGEHVAEDVAVVLADLPTVVSWLLHSNQNALIAAASRIDSARPTYRDGQPGAHRLHGADTALTAATLMLARIILDSSDQAVIPVLRAILSGLPSPRRVPPAGMSAPRWLALSRRFQNRYLRAADPDLLPTERLRLRTVIPEAQLPSTEPSVAPDAVTGDRFRWVPQLLWPDWAARLLPTAGFHPELFRAVFSVCLLIPGHPDRDLLPALTTQFNPRVRRANVTGMLAELGDKFGPTMLSQVLTLLCRLTNYLDQHGAPIDYQRRHDQVPTEPITLQQWRDLACSVGAHPGDRNPRGRLLLAQRHLHHLITGADLANRDHPSAFRNPNDRNRYVDFTASLTGPLRRALNEHAAALLTELGIDEPLTWSPPASLADGLDLPGIDTDTLDMDTISRLIVDEHRPPREAARALGVHIEHIRLALERLDRPQRHWSANAAPTAWLTEQRATRLFTREFFDREYIHKGRGLHELAEVTGIGRHIIARIAKQLGVPLNNGRAPFPIDPDWLREQYCDQLRSTADIAAELGTDQMTVNNALRRFGIPTRPAGILSHPHMITKLGKDVPRDIRAAVEGTLHGWYRLHRFQITMAFPSLHSAAGYLGTSQRTLTDQFQRLERDIGATLFHRGAYNKPHHPTSRGHTLLSDLTQDHIHQLMMGSLRTDQIHPKPSGKILIEAQRQAVAPRKPPQYRQFDDINVTRLRMTTPLKAVLRNLVDNPGEFYGHELLSRTHVSAGVIYDILHRLLNAGWLTSRPEDEQSWLAGAPPGCGPGRRRTYYSLTCEGRRAARHELHHHRFRNRKETKTQ